MKNKVKFSTYSIIVTAMIVILCVFGIFSLFLDATQSVPLCVIFVASTVVALFYCPIEVEADQSGITLCRLLSGPKVFSYDSIQSVDTCYPSAGGLRLCGSGGYFGYWGYFNDMMIGTYFGYYGSRGNCFLVKLKNGKQYVLGCEDATAMVDYINSQINK